MTTLILLVLKLTTMTIDNDKQFLLLQRQKGRPGTMSGVDNVLFGKEQRRKHRKQQTLSRQLRIEEEQSRHSARVVELESYASSSAEDDVDEYTDTNSVSACSVWSLKRKRGRQTVITPQLASALDRTKVSDRKATFIVAETVQSMGEDNDDLALNRSTIRRWRMQQRTKKSAAIKAQFHGDVPFVIHWDGKLILDLTGKEKHDQLPILVSGKGISKLMELVIGLVFQVCMGSSSCPEVSFVQAFSSTLGPPR